MSRPLSSAMVFIFPILTIISSLWDLLIIPYPSVERSRELVSLGRSLAWIIGRLDCTLGLLLLSPSVSAASPSSAILHLLPFELSGGLPVEAESDTAAKSGAGDDFLEDLVETRWRFDILFKIVLKMWSFNLVLTIVDPVPPKPQAGLRPTGLMPLGVRGKCW